MKKLTGRQLKMIRNILIIAGIIITVILWRFLPATFKNTPMFHAGNGETGTKGGFLIIALFPLFALIPDKGGEELHSTDQQEREEIANKREQKDAARQVAVAIAMDIVAWGVMAFAVLALG